MARHPAMLTVALGFGVFALSYSVTLGIVSLRTAAGMHAAPAYDASMCTACPSTPNAPALPAKAAEYAQGALGAALGAALIYSFNEDGILYESSSAKTSTSPYWFLDSGAKLIIADGMGETIQGALPEDDQWRATYARTSAADTDDGAHPQNLFRLLTQAAWTNARMEASLRVRADNLSESPNRNESNGLLLMSRYQDQDTLYYAGVRVDGTAVIKKKYRGAYYTLAQTAVFDGTYDPTNAPDLIPRDQWITLANETTTNADGSVFVRLFMADGDGWRLLLSARDDGSYGNTPPIVCAGAYGIRTDFMDVWLRAVRIVPQ